jgi:phosphatidylglycerophosphatase A
MNFGKHGIMFLATGFYLGKMPVAPGTFGSLLGLPLWIVLSKFEIVFAFSCLTVFILFATGVAHKASRLLKQKDPGCVVIDEIAGMAVTIAGLPLSWATIIAGFIVFRTLDIGKPFPVRWVDRHVKGGVGIVMDDVLAGIIGNVTLRIAFQLYDIVK